MVSKIGSRFFWPCQQKLINKMEPWVGIEPTHTLLQSVALPFGHQGVAGETGLEPATSGVTGQRSTLLNYSPKLERVVGLEPTTFCLASRCSTD